MIHMTPAAGRAYKVIITRFFRFAKGRECPLCGWTGFQFLPVKPGPFFRFDAKCPRCWSYERHRLAYVLLKDELAKPLGRVLHFAPEKPLAKWISTLASDYHTADISGARVRHKVDIQDMPFDSESFDLIWCSHVLEHVTDDAKAMREMRRVLRPGGKAIVQVPLWGERTVEEHLNSDAERLTHYLQEDHVRLYGRDFARRLEAAGFTVRTRTLDELPLQRVLRNALTGLADSEIFVATAI
jgi:SAM-dependent methyltransferase